MNATCKIFWPFTLSTLFCEKQVLNTNYEICWDSCLLVTREQKNQCHEGTKFQSSSFTSCLALKLKLVSENNITSYFFTLTVLKGITTTYQWYMPANSIALLTLYQYRGILEIYIKGLPFWMVQTIIHLNNVIAVLKNTW